ncbi:membrane protein insertion efficiency factor YidD [Argonema antarcticum A004/B2]|nr:membrane protein insertion efficiency factor YidD [Argonema antarcticum]MCL1473753.1 membrane protein insertion efficiency factor YidD [Argonema antarcticum A004/B2]
MQTSTFESVTQITLINLISGYQKSISPKKGFACPHRLLHGGESCSDYVKNILTEQSLVSALESSIQRFRNCALASKTLTSAHTNAGFRCIVLPCCFPL